MYIYKYLIMRQERWQYHFEFTAKVGVLIFRALRLNTHVAKFSD